MANVKLACICVVLFTLCLAFIILVLTSINGFSKCDDCETLRLWVSMNNSVVEVGTTEPLITTNVPVKIFDFNVKNDDIYWVEASSHDSTKIFRSHLKDSKSMRRPKYQLVAELAGCGGLAVDWLHNHLYWTDSVDGVVVARLNGNNRRYVFNTINTEITSVAVDPLQGLLFWMEKIREKHKHSQFTVQIKSSNFRGQEVKIIVQPFVIPIRDLSNGITLDVTEQKLYFIEYPGVLAMCDYDGGNRIEVKTDLPSPVTFTVSRKQLYWMNKMGEVYTLLKTGKQAFLEAVVCKECNETERKNVLDRGFQLKVFDGRMQPSPENQTLIHDCLMNYNLSTDICPCSFGYRQVENSNLCMEEGFFLASFGSSIQGIYSDGVKFTLLFKRNAKITKFDYHFEKGILIWFDSRESIIYRAPIINPSKIIPLALSAKGTACLAVDWIYDHVYWTNNNAKGGTVEVSKLDGSHRLQVIPRNLWSKLESIALDPARGTMYISNWTEGTIEVVGMDGYNVMNLVTSGLRSPRSLTLDIHKVSPTSYEARQLFWLETAPVGQTSSIVIKSCYLQNRQNCREVFDRKSGPRPTGLTLFNNHIYWLDKYALHIATIDTRRRDIKKINIRDKHLVSYSFKAYHSQTQPPGKDLCLWRSCHPHSLCLPSNVQYSQRNTRCISKIPLQELDSLTKYFNSNRN